VKRRQLGELFQPARDRVVDQGRLAKICSAVDNAVGDGGDPRRCGFERVDGLCRAFGRDERQLQARRPGVDDEDGILAQ